MKRLISFALLLLAPVTFAGTGVLINTNGTTVQSATVPTQCMPASYGPFWGTNAVDGITNVNTSGNPVTLLNNGFVTINQNGDPADLDVLDVVGQLKASLFTGDGSGLTSLNASQLTSGNVPSQSQYPVTNFTAYAVGTAYTMTGSSTALTFGTTQPVLTINQAGTYMIVGTVGVKYNGATYAAAQTMTFKLRRTNNTAADLTNGARTTELPVLTTFTGGDAVTFPHVIYTATSGDTVTIFGILSATPAAGTVLADSADLIAIRLY